MSLMMTVSQMTREGHHGQVGGRAPATLAVNMGLFLGAPRPVEGHRRQWPSWPSIISYPEFSIQAVNLKFKGFHTYGVFTPEQDNDKTNVEPVHSYDAFHTRPVGPGVKGIIGMYRFKMCLVVFLLSCSGVKIWNLESQVLCID